MRLEEFAKRRSRRNELIKKYLLVVLFLLPFIASFLMFFLWPLIYGIHISTTDFTYSKPGQEVWNNFKWYEMIFVGKANRSSIKIHEAFWRSFMHSFVFAIIMVPIAVIVPLLLANLVHIKPPGFKLFRALIYMPSIVPLTAAGTIFALLFMPVQQHGLLAELFPGLGPTEWFVATWFKFNIGEFTIDVAWGWIPIFLMCFWGGWGGNFIILSAGLENVPTSLYQAASIDGCGRFKQLMHVTIPGIKGQLVLCLFTTIIGYLGLYGQNYVLSTGGPAFTTLATMPGGGKTSTIIYFIQDIVANNNNFKEKLYGLGAAASLVYALMVGIISGIQMWATREKKSGTKLMKEYQQWQMSQR